MSTAIALVNQQEDYSREKIDLIKRTLCADATDDELQLFLYTAKRTGLDPLARQIHMVKRWNSDQGRKVAAIQTGIDGYRLIADRTGKLAGISDVAYDDESSEHPGKATVTVSKMVDGSVREFTASARWTEYVQDKGPMWKKMPFLMLGKCAEALALRKAFPADLSGVYTFEEMGQADNEHEDGPKKKPPVTQPSRASEKKAEAKAEPKPVEVKLDRISGVIETLKEGKDGAVWIVADKKTVLIVADKVDDDIHVGNKFFADCLKLHSARIGDYWEAKIILEDPEIQDAEIIEETTDPVASFNPLPAGAPTLEELQANGSVKPASSVEAPKTIGLNRAKRLYIIARNNEANTGFTEEQIKKLLSILPKPLEHLRDLESGMYRKFEEFALGEDSSWKTLIEESGK